ncbi:hypothetical protein OAT67_02245 [Bacteriovoracaceae bacterium]|nr:hypothetical protein [Bacteriovoracaceae bacterium]
MSQKRKNKELKRKNKKRKKEISSRNKQKQDLKLFDESELALWRDNLNRSTSFSNGLELEEIIERLCLRVGFPDLIFKSPKYRDTKGREKEICDLLINLGNKLIVFQVKHKTLNANKDAEIIANRANSVISHAQGQFSTILSLLETSSLGVQQTLSEISVNLDEHEFDELILIAVVAYPGMIDFPENKRFEVMNGYSVYKDKSLHIFDLNDFDKVSLELDTFPDLLGYFSYRKKFYSDVGMKMSKELDFLAFYKMNTADIESYFKENSKIHLESGIWDGYVSNRAKDIYQRNRDNNISYLYDRLVAKSKMSIGYNPLGDNHEELSYGPGTKEAYLATLIDFSNFNRVERRSMGDAMKTCVFRAEENFVSKKRNEAFRLIQFGDNGRRAFIALAVKEGELTRRQRITFLSNLCQTAKLKFGFDNVIGIATESLNCSERSEDYVSVGGELVYSDDELERMKTMSEQIWSGQPTFFTDTEFR